MGIFKKITCTSRKKRGEAEEMVIDHFVQNSWADYVEQVRTMNANEKAEIAADFQACGMSDAMTLS